MKKFINNLDTCVWDSLNGVVAVNPGVKLLEGYQVILRSDIEEFKLSGKVTLLTGGGSGHEPAHVGYVGLGMLSGAIAGSIFASPSVKSILAAIEAVKCEAGTLLIVKNYTGDRLNFGLALEQARARGIKIDMVIIGEDCALSDINQTAGRRGLCGTVLVHKIAGSMAEERKSLNDITTFINMLMPRLGTISLSLNGCNIPGQKESFSLKDDEMELGLGIHGEAGVKRIKHQSANECVATMFSHMTDSQSQTCLSINKGDRVSLMVNNLGGTSVLELNIVGIEAIKWLESKGVVVERVYCGTFMTALNMKGVSLTVLHIDDDIVRLLDRPTPVTAWSSAMQFQGSSLRSQRDTIKDTLKHSDTGRVVSCASIGGEQILLIKNILNNIAKSLIASEEQLNTLDAESGDGDCGTTMKCCAIALQKAINSNCLEFCYPSRLMLNLSDIIKDSIGGTSGALYAIFTSAAAKSLLSDVSPAGWCDAFGDALKAVMKYGRAQPGYRTMVDPMDEFHKVLSQNLSEGWSMALLLATKAAENKATETRFMTAKAGRASYVNSDRLTHADPGAQAFAIWIRALCDSCTS